MVYLLHELAHPGLCMGRRESNQCLKCPGSDRLGLKQLEIFRHTYIHLKFSLHVWQLLYLGLIATDRLLGPQFGVLRGDEIARVSCEHRLRREKQDRGQFRYQLMDMEYSTAHRHRRGFRAGQSKNGWRMEVLSPILCLKPPYDTTGSMHIFWGLTPAY